MVPEVEDNVQELVRLWEVELCLVLSLRQHFDGVTTGMVRNSSQQQQ